MTEQEALEKLKDKSWRMSHLYKIKTKDRQLITFKPNAVQADYIAHKSNRDEILKARQHGFTTLKCIDGLDETIWNKNTNSVIIAHKREKVMSIFEIVKLAFNNLPDELKPRVSFDNRNELAFPDLNSKIYVTMDTRSEMVHNMHISELAFMRDAESVLTAALESVPENGTISIESTANGMSGALYEIWEDDKSEFKKHFYSWTWNEEYAIPTTQTLEELQAEYGPMAVEYNLIPDIYDRYELTLEQFAWYVKKAHRLRDRLPQEYPINDLEAFIASGRNVFSQHSLNKHAILSPIERKWDDLFIWEQPLDGFRYSIGCDPSEGVGGDNAVISVLNAHTGEQAAEFAVNDLPPDELADLLLNIAVFYNKGFIVIEMNSIGRSTLDKIKKKYMNLYRREVLDKFGKQYEKKIGWRTTSVTKPILVNDLEEAVREQHIVIHSKGTLNEMKTFVRTDEQGTHGFAAEGNKKDDRVIAIGLALQGMKQLPSMKAPKSIAQKKLDEFTEQQNLNKHFPNTKPVLNHHQRRNYKIRGV